MKQLLSSWTFLLNSLSMDFKTKTEHHGLLGESVALILLKCLHLLYVNGFDISHLLHFHCKWGPESNSLPHSLDTLCPVSCLISLQLFPWGMCGLKTAEVILQKKPLFSYFRCLSKNMSPCVKTCVVQVGPASAPVLRCPKILLPRPSLQGASKGWCCSSSNPTESNHRVSPKSLEKHPCLEGFVHVWFLKILLSCSADAIQLWWVMQNTFFWGGNSWF